MGEDANVANCLTDEKTKEILKDSTGELRFTQEGQTARNKKVREWLAEQKKKTVEIRPHYTTEAIKVPDDISYAEADAFYGFVLAEIPEPTDAESEPVTAIASN